MRSANQAAVHPAPAKKSSHAGAACNSENKSSAAFLPPTRKPTSNMVLALALSAELNGQAGPILPAPPVCPANTAQRHRPPPNRHGGCTLPLHLQGAVHLVSRDAPQLRHHDPLRAPCLPSTNLARLTPPQEMNEMSGSRGEANFVWKCKNCKVALSLSAIHALP